jgi:adenosine deaminase
MADHALPQLLRAGCKVTINADDPAYFGGYLNDNWLAMFDAQPTLTAHDAWQMARNGFDAAFITAEQRASWQTELDVHWSALVRPA